MYIAGMILGILAILFAWIPLIGLIVIPLVATGLPLSIVGFRNKPANKPARLWAALMGTTGIVTNLASIALILLQLMMIAEFASQRLSFW